jgi:RNA polymerase sigma-70 factor (ECF subfamily)
VRGTADDLRELYVATHGRLLAAVAGVCDDVQDAEDCVSEAFARALVRWDRIGRYDDPEGWVRRVAFNLAKSRWRRATRSAHFVSQAPFVPALSEDHVALLEALRRLPDSQREAITLHYLADLPIDEVAAHQRVPVGTVKARLSRGRRTLADLLSIVDSEVKQS